MLVNPACRGAYNGSGGIMGARKFLHRLAVGLMLAMSGLAHAHGTGSDGGLPDPAPPAIPDAPPAAPDFKKEQTWTQILGDPQKLELAAPYFAAILTKAADDTNNNEEIFKIRETLVKMISPSADPNVRKRIYEAIGRLYFLGLGNTERPKLMPPIPRFPTDTEAATWLGTIGHFVFVAMGPTSNSPSSYGAVLKAGAILTNTLAANDKGPLLSLLDRQKLPDQELTTLTARFREMNAKAKKVLPLLANPEPLPNKDRAAYALATFDSRWPEVIAAVDNQVPGNTPMPNWTNPQAWAAQVKADFAAGKERTSWPPPEPPKPLPPPPLPPPAPAADPNASVTPALASQPVPGLDGVPTLDPRLQQPPPQAQQPIPQGLPGSGGRSGGGGGGGGGKGGRVSPGPSAGQIRRAKRRLRRQNRRLGRILRRF